MTGLMVSLDLLFLSGELIYLMYRLGMCFFLQQVTVLSKSELCIYPSESSKSSLHYTMQQLKTDLPDVLIKVS